MLVYQFMSAEHAMDNLHKRRLKVSLLEDLNDPFELLGARLAHSEHRTQLRAWRKYMAAISRLLCFSKSYMNPVLWSHYADKHRGMCLAFEVPKHILLDVAYDADRLAVDFRSEAITPRGVSFETAQRLLTTKFADWQYESEVRMFLRPEDVVQDNGLQFFPFGDELSLRAVYVGSRCKVRRKQVKAALRAEDQRTLVHATRLAFKSFRVIRTPWSTSGRDDA
jgi:hypothetical protein